MIVPRLKDRDLEVSISNPEKTNRSKTRAKNEISSVLFDICIKDCAWLNFLPALALFSEN
jgi:hypothetical protein